MKWFILFWIGFIFCIGIDTIIKRVEESIQRALDRNEKRRVRKCIEELCRKTVPDYETRTREERAKIRRIMKNTISWGKELDRIYGKRERRRRRGA